MTCCGKARRTLAEAHHVAAGLAHGTADRYKPASRALRHESTGPDRLANRLCLLRRAVLGLGGADSCEMPGDARTA